MQSKKYYGQNFINSPVLIERIVDLLEPELYSDNLVIEIGPGKGALTSVLTKRFKKVIAIEIDSDLTELLRTKNKSPNLEIVEADVLKIDWPKFIEQYLEPQQKVFIISNLPYYITSPILFNIYKNAKLFNRAVLMLQKEVADRISATKNDKNYNNLSVVSQFFGDIDFAFEVSRKSFRPQPKVDSAVIKINFFPKLKINQTEVESFVNFVRQLFNNRRKTILNNLSRTINDKNQAAGYLQRAQINQMLRPENLDLEDFVRLFKVQKK